MKVYIAGPMKGLPKFNFDAFDAAKANLEAHGYQVISPADLDRDIGFDPERDADKVDAAFLDRAMRRDFEAIMSVDAVVMLPGWERSTGATSEMWLAKWRHIPILLYPSLKPIGGEDVLEEALRITSGDRQNAYGSPKANFERIGALWSALLGVSVDAKDVALCMIAVKLARSVHSDKRDNWVDIAGYARAGFLAGQEKP